MDQVRELLLELDKLKTVYRKSYLSDQSRNENSAEHSWHLAVAVIALSPYQPLALNGERLLRLALLHDVCEIGADLCFLPSVIISQEW